MLHSETDRRRAFSTWLRTGRLPAPRSADGVELKFNPYHDPRDGRFTFAAGGQAPAGRTAGTKQTRASGTPSAPSPSRQNLRQLPRQTQGTDRGNSGRNPWKEAYAGFGEGLYDTAAGTAQGIKSILTTNPLTTVQNVNHNIAGMVDSAIAAEDVPARIQVARAANAVASATPRQIGHAAGRATGEAALTFAPGAGVAKLAEIRYLRKLPLRVPFEPIEIKWVKETISSDKPWAIYNDGAPGARRGLAPVLMRTLPNGTKRAVKFDGIMGDWLIDRKWSVRDMPRARAQIMRQSAALTEHRMIGLWEVPNQAVKDKCLKIFAKMNVRNIHVRVVAP